MIPDWFQEDVKVVITGNTNGHGFKIGEVVILGKTHTRPDLIGRSRKCCHLDGRLSNLPYVRYTDCKPVELPSVEDLLG